MLNRQQAHQGALAARQLQDAKNRGKGSLLEGHAVEIAESSGNKGKGKAKAVEVDNEEEDEEDEDEKKEDDDDEDEDEDEGGKEPPKKKVCCCDLFAGDFY